MTTQLQLINIITIIKHSPPQHENFLVALIVSSQRYSSAHIQTNIPYTTVRFAAFKLAQIAPLSSTNILKTLTLHQDLIEREFWLRYQSSLPFYRVNKRASI